MRDEIFEQPQVFERLLASSSPMIAEVAGQIRTLIADRRLDFVLLAGRGTSDNAGVYAQYVWGVLNQMPVALAAPSLYTAYQARHNLERALVVGISQSGQSPDVVTVIGEGRRQGAMTLAITNDPGSPLAQEAAFAIDLGAGIERAVAATKTYTAELLVIAALAAALRGESQYADQLQRLPELMAQALQLESVAAELAQRYARMDRCVVLGRGFHYATAKEWALKLKELAYVMADPYSTADFQHGPIALVEPDFPVLAVVSRGPLYAGTLALLTRLKVQSGAMMLVISDGEEAGAPGGLHALGESGLRIPPETPEWLSPLIAIAPAQLFCYYLAHAKGHDPDAPRGLHKVTLTR
jgi:glucosamine--fructose-6-phosphate aminotransferase (isomerizing)